MRRLRNTLRYLPVAMAALLAINPSLVKAENEQASEAIRQTLNKKVSVDFQGLTVEELAKTLSEKYSIPTTLQRKVVDSSGFERETRLNSVKLDNASMRTVLNLMLKEYDLSWFILDGVMVITTVDDASGRVRTKIYDVRDIVTAQRGAIDLADIPAHSLDAEPLITLITSIVVPPSWDAVGGPGVIKAINGMLVVSQTDFAHDEIETLLGDLRRTQARRIEVLQPASSQTNEKADPKAMQLRTYQIRLRQFEWKGGCILYSRIPVVGGVERPMGIDKDAQIRGSVASENGNASQVLAQFGRTNPTQKPADSSTNGVLSPPEPFPVVRALSEAIPTMIEPHSWQQGGGEGSICALPIGHGTLLVRQTPVVHAKIVRLLLQLGALGGLD